jgi:hypothetical protein
MYKRSVFAAAVALILAVATLSAQDANGRISGTITDSTGAVIPKAHVRVTNQSTGLTRKTVGDSKGFYIVTVRSRLTIIRNGTSGY